MSGNTNALNVRFNKYQFNRATTNVVIHHIYALTVKVGNDQEKAQ